MASTYSDYKFELIGTGEQAGTWGATTNTNLGTAIEQAIGGKADITMSSTSQTLTLTDTNAAQDARALYLNLSGTPGGAATLNVPAIEKAYIVKNGTNQTVTVKVTGQTGVAIPTGKTMHLYNNGTDVVNAVDNLPSGATLNGVAIGAVANGGTGQTSYTNGQLLIGNTTGNTLTKATLTAGTGISVTNGAGSITIASTAGDVVGPASSADNYAVVFDGTSGKLIKSGGAGFFGSPTGLLVGYDITGGEILYGNYLSSNSATDTILVGSNISANSSSQSIFIGKHISNNSGLRSIYIGYTAGTNGISDSICIGNNIGSAANQFRFGKSGNFVYNNFTVDNSWTQSSDARLKRNVQDSNLGLSFITKLRPVTFQWVPSTEVPEKLTNHHFKENKKDLEATMNGFIAQEVKQALDEVGAVTHGIWSEQEDGTQALSREMFIMPLVNAVKELKAEIDTLKAEIATLKGG